MNFRHLLGCDTIDRSFILVRVTIKLLNIFSLLCVSRYFLSLVRSGNRSFNLFYRYTDDLIVFNNKKFGKDYVKDIYPFELRPVYTNRKRNDCIASAHRICIIFISFSAFYTKTMETIANGKNQGKSILCVSR